MLWVTFSWEGEFCQRTEALRGYFSVSNVIVDNDVNSRIIMKILYFWDEFGVESSVLIALGTGVFYFHSVWSRTR